MIRHKFCIENKLIAMKSFIKKFSSLLIIVSLFYLSYSIIQTSWFANLLSVWSRDNGKFSLFVERVKYDINHPLQISFYHVTLSEHNQPAIIIASRINFQLSLNFKINSLEADDAIIAPDNMASTKNIYALSKQFIFKNVTVLASKFSPGFKSHALVINLHRQQKTSVTNISLAAQNIQFNKVTAKRLGLSDIYQ